MGWVMAKKLQLFVCTKGKHCKRRGAKKILCRLAEELQEHGLEKKICLKKSECLGKCGRGPAVQVLPTEEIYGLIKSDHCEEFVLGLKHKKRPPKKLLLQR